MQTGRSSLGIRLWVLLARWKPSSISHYPSVYTLSTHSAITVACNIGAIQSYSFEPDACSDEENRDVRGCIRIEWSLFVACVVDIRHAYKLFLTAIQSISTPVFYICRFWLFLNKPLLNDHYTFFFVNCTFLLSNIQIFLGANFVRIKSFFKILSH